MNTLERLTTDDRPRSAVTESGPSFDDVVLPHLDAAYQLARWLLRNDDDAEDVVQEAAMRAFRYFRTFTGGTGRGWFLTIVRNTCAGWRGSRGRTEDDVFDEEQHSGGLPASDPETLLLRTDDATVLARAMRHLPDRVRRLLVLREFEGLSYRELADAFHVPVGTVMSRLSRARQALRDALERHSNRTTEYSKTFAD
jgi:RNA polymerase sigma-70 factor, ECF subfamily